MNFLSHYYFDKTSSPYQIMGCVLPDLIKNADKSINLYPLKNEVAFTTPEAQLLLAGWRRHLEIDKYFHSDPFFVEHTATIKTLILPVTEGTAIRPSFLAHIGLELLLDHLLLEKNQVHPDDFYQALEKVDTSLLHDFLSKAGLENPGAVLDFIARFNSSRYLLSYQKLENISYALNRICMRVWPSSMDQHRMDNLTTQLVQFKRSLQGNFESIFISLKSRLN